MLLLQLVIEGEYELLILAYTIEGEFTEKSSHSLLHSLAELATALFYSSLKPST